MAFPWVFYSNFEGGTNGEWDSESDTGSKLDFPHWSEVATRHGTVPYRGAYCMRIDFRPADTNNHILVEGDIDIANGVTRYFRWLMWLSPDFSATADDNFSIFELQQADATQEFVVGLRVQEATDAVNFWVAINDTPETHSNFSLQKGKWLNIEVAANVDTAAANGQVIVYVDGTQHVTLATAVQNAGAVGTGNLGTQNTLATTLGTVLIDEFVMDDARVYPIVDRYPLQVRLTKSGHAFVGPGIIENVTLQAGAATDNTVTVYDTDRGNTNDASKVVAVITNVTASDVVDIAGFPAQVTRGAYVSLGGTNPRAIVTVRPSHYAESALKAAAPKYRRRPLEV